MRAMVYLCAVLGVSACVGSPTQSNVKFQAQVPVTGNLLFGQ